MVCTENKKILVWTKAEICHFMVHYVTRKLLFHHVFTAFILIQHHQIIFIRLGSSVRNYSVSFHKYLYVTRFISNNKASFYNPRRFALQWSANSECNDWVNWLFYDFFWILNCNFSVFSIGFTQHDMTFFCAQDKLSVTQPGMAWDICWCLLVLELLSDAF